MTKVGDVYCLLPTRRTEGCFLSFVCFSLYLYVLPSSPSPISLSLSSSFLCYLLQFVLYFLTAYNRVLTIFSLIY
jgi:hypothetical protein